MRSGVHSALWTLFYLSVWHATTLDFSLAKQQVDRMHTVSFDWFLSGFEWILNFNILPEFFMEYQI